MRNCLRLVIVPACATLLSSCGQPAETPLGSAQAVTSDSLPGADWPAYNRTVAGDRFSPLTEIDRSNVAELQLLCSYTLPEVTALQTGPVVVDGTMFFTSEAHSYAIDGASCDGHWTVEHTIHDPSGAGLHRGFAYSEGRLFRGTSAAHVLALDARDGSIVWDRDLDLNAPGVTMPMAAIAADDLVFIGNAGGDMVGVTGHVFALSAADGQIVWRFDVVPDTPTVRDTWPNSDRYPITGGAFWTSFSFDAANDVLYVPAGNPAPDFDAQARGGDNLYTNSLIALDGSTGALLGYNQLVRRDSHDWDVNTAPVLAVTRAGRQVVASANKDGLLSVLDRSSLPAALRSGNESPATRLPLIYQAETTTRLNVDVPLSREQPVRFCPGILGGNEWNGAAFDPGSSTFYVGAGDWCATVQLQSEPVVPAIGTLWFGSVDNNVQAPPEEAKGWVTAFDADTGAVRWRFATPRPVFAGVTPTAGALVFAADVGGTVRAFDSESGTVLWQYAAGQAIGGGIVSFESGGRQRIGVAAGLKSAIWPGGTEPGRILVFGIRG